MNQDTTPNDELVRLLSTTPDGLLVVGRDGVIRYANPAAHDLFERPGEGLVGELLGLPDVAGVYDIELVLAGGNLRTVELRAVPTSWAGESVWVVALRDATEQRRRETELKAALSESDDLANELAHELNTPLAVIIGVVETLERHWNDVTEYQRRDMIRRVGSQARRLYRMLRRMRLVERASTNIAVEPVALWEVALAHLPELGLTSVQIDCPRDLRVLADPAHVDEIVVNLVENADKYGAPPIVVRARRRGDVVELAVCDHGPGVPENFVPRLFDRYSRAEETRRSRSGVGLGLELVARLARASGGDVRYEPNKPQGACFLVTLPAVDGPDDAVS